MKKFDVVLYAISAVLLTIVSGKPSEANYCKNLKCNNTVTCPDDSQAVLAHDGHGRSNYHSDFDTINHNHNNHNTEDNINSNSNSNGNSDFDDIKIEANNKDNLLKTLIKRSVSHERRAPIKIVPGDYIRNRRDSEDTNNTRHHHSHSNSHNEEDLFRLCCPAQKCECKPDPCPVPICPPSLISEPVHAADELIRPGNCCPKYRCLRPKACVLPSSKIYQHGEGWWDDVCTYCECINGESKCFISSCKPSTCLKTITLDGECCPKCDNSGSDFCPGTDACDRVCKHGYVHDEARNCSLCSCAKQNRNNTYYNNTHNDRVPSGDTRFSSTFVNHFLNATTSTATVNSTPGAVAAGPGTNVSEAVSQEDNSESNDNFKTLHGPVSEGPEEISVFTIILSGVFFVVVIVIGLFIWQCVKVQRSYRTVPSLDSNLNRIGKFTKT